jgi:hypothetical protein
MNKKADHQHVFVKIQADGVWNLLNQDIWICGKIYWQR